MVGLVNRCSDASLSKMNVFGTINDSDNNPLHGGECGKRLMPHVIDATAIATPDADCFFIPRTYGNPRDGWQAVSWAQVANAVNYVAHLLIEQAGTPTPGTFPTIAYIGLEDPRYVLFIMGAIKAGYKALFISPRNSVEAQVNLFEKTDCNLLYHDQSLASMVKPWVAGRPGMKSLALPPWAEWMTPVAPFPYTKTFEEAEWDPFVVLHTSGSTGLPKPVMLPQGKLALNDLHRYVPDHDGNMPWLSTWGKFDNPRYLCTCPLFHTAGIAPTVLSGFYYNTPVIFRDPSVPLTGNNVVEWLQNSGATYTVLPPVILEQMSRSQEALDELKRLQVVAFGGGPISPAAADSLLKNNVKLVNAIGATEYIYMPYYTQPDSSLWEWFIVPTEMLGIEWRPFGEDTFEQVVIRQKKGHPGLQGCFYVFPELDEYKTNDLFRPHPTLRDHWTYVGRADDIIVFSTGEKLNPTTIEGAVIGHPGVIGAQVVGAGQFHAALLIEPAQQPANEQEKRQFLDDIWPVIEKVNKETVAHGRILRDYIFLSDPERPFPRAGKGTIQRAMATKLYADDVRRIFESASDTSVVAVELDFSSETTLADGIRDLVQQTVKMPALGVDDDFFTMGVDSLQVLHLARVLSASVKKTIEGRNIYSHPSIAKLTSFINSLAGLGSNGVAVTSTEADTLALCSALVEKYTQDIPSPATDKPVPATTNQTIIISGTTGAIGCYLLDLALANPDITKIYCFNRTPDARERQIAASDARGISADFSLSRVEFLTVDLSSATFGLPEDIFTSLAGTVDRIIHNAWPVDFNQSIASFEPHLRGVRNLINFSAAATKRIPITFVSSVSTVEQWPESTPIPEQPLSDFTHASQMGYGQSKLAASLILDAVASSVPRNIVRVGQVAGPRAEKGQWNPREWLPSLIRSSLFLGLLPSELGLLGNLGWAPVEDIAGVILEVTAGQENNGGYFHAVNPNLPDWEGVIAPVLTKFYGSRIERVVSLEEWVEALAKSAVGDVDLEMNPGVKLLDTYRLASMKVDGEVAVAGFATERTEKASETMRKMEPVTAELMERWCQQWQF